MNVHLDERAIADGFGKRGKRGETGGNWGRKRGVPSVPKAVFGIKARPPAAYFFRCASGAGFETGGTAGMFCSLVGGTMFLSRMYVTRLP